MEHQLFTEGDEFGLPVHVFAKNKREQLRISINEFKGINYIDLRIFYNSGSGYKPSRKGLTLAKEQYIELFRGIVELGGALGFDEQTLAEAIDTEPR